MNPTTYIALGVLAVLAVLVPLGMLMTNWLIGANPKQNAVKLANYESSEAPIGTNRDITNEYLHYFPLYLGFELTAVVILAWAFVFDKTETTTNLLMIGLLAIAFVFSMFAIKIAGTKVGDENYGKE